MKRKSIGNRRVLAVILAVLMVCSALQSPALADSGHAETGGAVQETVEDAGVQAAEAGRTAVQADENGAAAQADGEETCAHQAIQANGYCPDCKTQFYFALTAGGSVSYAQTLMDLDMLLVDYDTDEVLVTGSFTVKLLADYHSEDMEHMGLITGQDMTLDLNGKSLIMENRAAIDIEGASLTVTGNGIVGIPMYLSVDYSEESGGSLTIENGRFYHPIFGTEDCTLTIKDGVFAPMEEYEDESMGGISAEKGAKVKIYGGEFFGGKNNVMGDFKPYPSLENEDGTLEDILAEGKAIVKADDPSVFVDMSQSETLERVKVIDHTHSLNAEGQCACGYGCRHKDGNSREAGYFQKAICKTCGLEYGDLVADTTQPTGTITIDERNSWEEFINKISFGLFYKEKVKVTITAEDDSYRDPGYTDDQAVKIEYLLAEGGTTYDETSIKNQTFTAYDPKTGIIPPKDWKYVVYARLTDHAGNVTYLSTDGFTVDTKAPVIGIPDGGSFCLEQGKSLVDESNLVSLTVDGTELSFSGAYGLNYFTMSLEDNEPDGTKKTITAVDAAGNQSSVTISLYRKHEFDPETGLCRHQCGRRAAAKLTVDGTDTIYQYGSELFAALQTANGKDVTVTLLSDLSAENICFSGTSYTLDLNGKTLEISRDQEMVGGSRMIIQDSDPEGKGCLKGIMDDESCRLRVSDGVLRVQSGTIELPIDYPGTPGLIYLTGGTFKELRCLDDAYNVTQLLYNGYVYRSADGILLKGEELKNTASLQNVSVEQCGHTEISVGGAGQDIYTCPYCREDMQAVILDGEETIYYTEFTDAFNAAKTKRGCTVRILQKEVGLRAQTIKDAVFTVDLNGKTWKLWIDNYNYDVAVGAGAELTICDTAGGGVVNAQRGTALSARQGTLRITGGTYTGSAGGCVKQHTTEGTLIITGGTFDRVQSIAGDSPFTFLGEGLAFVFADGTYAKPSDISSVVAGMQVLYNVSVALAPFRIAEQPKPVSFYTTTPESEREALKISIQSIGLDNGETVSVQWKNEDGTAAADAKELTITAGTCVDTVHLGAGTYYCEISYKGYVLQSDTVTATETVCGHPSRNDDGKCSQCHCELAASVTLGERTTYYETFAEALGAAQTEENRGSTLTIYQDIADNAEVSGGSFTLEAGTNTISGTVQVESGAELIIGSGTITGAVTVQGSLMVQGGSLSDTVTAADGAVLTVRDGSLGIVSLENGASAFLSGGSYKKLASGGEGTLRSFLTDKDSLAYAGKADDQVVNGEVSELENLKIVSHTHSYEWNHTTHEEACGCGSVRRKDNVKPELRAVGIGTPLEDGVTYYYYGTEFRFTVTDVDDDGAENTVEVRIDGMKTSPEDGEYVIQADNGEHSIEAVDAAGNTVSLKVHVLKVYRAVLPVGEGYTVSTTDDAGEIRFGHNFQFKVELAPGYSKTDSYQVLVNGTPASAVSGTLEDYQVFNVKSDLTITVEGVADITPPEAEITIGENRFKSFLNTVTFGLFFKNTQTVTVTAADVNIGSGVAKAEYLLSETAFAEETAVDGAWTELELKDGEGTFTMAPNQKAFVYVRVTDRAGNITVLNSDGIVVYTDAAAETERITFVKMSGDDQTVKLDLNGNTVRQIQIMGQGVDQPIDQASYHAAADGTVTIDGDVFQSLEAGSYTLYVTYDPMGEDYREAEGNEAPSVSRIALTVARAEGTVSGLSDISKEYDGQPVSAPVYDSLSTGAAAVEYKVFGAGDETYTVEAPKNAGTYEVRVIVEADGSYSEASESGTFKISPRRVTIQGTAVEAQKVYDGTDTAAITETGTLSANYDGENLVILAGTAAYDNKNAGTGKTVTFTGFALTGSAAGNYELTAQPESVTASILAYTAAGNEYTRTSGDWINTDFVVTAADGWLLSRTNTADGAWSETLTESEETADGTLVFYVKNQKTGVISEAISEAYKIDKTKPAGEIRIDAENHWDSFTDPIAFETFFRAETDVELKGTDGASGVAEVEYLLSAEEYTMEELETMEFTGYEEAISLKPDSRWIVYMKLTDKAGNVTYLRSGGIVLDALAPVITGIEDGKTYCEAQTVTVSEENLKSVTVNGEEITLVSTQDVEGGVGISRGTFVLNPAEGVQIIVVTDKAGNETTYAVTVNDGHTGGTATCVEQAHCAVCGSEYGEPDPENHTALRHVPAKAATVEAEGNLEYWYCDGCKTYFADQKGTKKITEESVKLEKLPPQSGTGGSGTGTTGTGSSAGTGAAGSGNGIAAGTTAGTFTGDQTRIFLWIAVLAVSGGVIAIVFGRKRKDHTK